MNNVKIIFWIILIFIVWTISTIAGTGLFIKSRQQPIDNRTEISELERKLTTAQSRVTELEKSAELDGIRIDKLEIDNRELTESNNRLIEQLNRAQSTIYGIITGFDNLS